MASKNAFMLTCIPNEGKSEAETMMKLTDALKNKNDFAEVHRVELPKLLVGTLDSLISLSDDLTKIDMACENAVRKIERQYMEINQGEKDTLLVNNKTPEHYLKNFVWEHARYPYRRPLQEIVGHIQQGVGKIEEELKALAASYTEKTQMQQANKRKKGGNLMVCSLDDVLTREKVRDIEFHDSEHFITLVAVVPKNSEEDWVANYASVGCEIAPYGGQDWTGREGRVGSDDKNYGREYTARAATMGSPVVPGSSIKIMEDSEFCLYTVTILRGCYEAGFVDGDAEGEFVPGQYKDFIQDFKKAAKEHRFTIREFSFDENKAVDNKNKSARLDMEVDQLHTGIIRWCRAHFGEALVAWLHVKAIRLFVEAVLRYGLPVDYTSAVIKPKKNCDKKVDNELMRMFGHLTGQLGGGDGDDEEAYTAYVAQKFALTL
eukprot:CAMPEP_0113942796 /NCGR_PEP_ID=MMETSP1339-20121228/9650_1 /TAXON_ID=94617 /ORGANISM="Fibrocapsa japonica" /LENGTH=432 /DNA_ID=CAMNT_0000947419 /DNA_START=35 /DNA_END=1333 /DNA_ORIENTATION=+ /assembly_acc=CAM_ASM_000762